MSNLAVDQIKQSLLNDLNRIIESAKKLNLVIEITLNSKEPLAMGNFEMIPSVREARDSQFQLLSEEQVEEIGNCLKTLKRTAGIMPWIGNTYLLCENIDGRYGPIGVITEELYLNKIVSPKVESTENVDNINKPDGGG